MLIGFDTGASFPRRLREIFHVASKVLERVAIEGSRRWFTGTGGTKLL